ncbi:MAG TPA: glycerophosphodiester phosphodiesterase [Solirubrobacteraceae bacterium]|nr:glycerophosphodiester phosphodiesterase [Solirubrobacteraceae bacterium]
MSDQCLVIAHRGAWGTAVPNTPAENTLEAFEAAIVLGADMIELDVRRTRDGQLVVFHDARVKTVPTSALAYEALKSKHGNQRPPLLQDVLTLTKDRISLNLEIKETGYIEETITLLRPFGLDRCLVSSFLDDVVREAKAIAPELQTGLLVGTGFRRALNTRLPSTGADCLVVHRRLADATALAKATAAGVPCLVWTVNAPRTLDRYLANPAIEGVITDRPALALQRRGAINRRHD